MLLLLAVVTPDLTALVRAFGRVREALPSSSCCPNHRKIVRREPNGSFWTNPPVFFGLWMFATVLLSNNLIGILGRVLPEAKYVWLVRDGRDVVASTTARGWYDAEYTSGVWGEYRLRGDAVGEVGTAVWDAMTPFA